MCCNQEYNTKFKKKLFAILIQFQILAKFIVFSSDHSSQDFV